MKKLAAVFALALFMLAAPAHAQSRAGRKSIERLEEKFGIAYMNSALGSLDAEYPVFRKVKIVIEHSLAGDTDKDRFEIKEFKRFAQAERWLSSRQREDGTPFRIARDLRQCRNGLCTYNFDGGILHNQLYIKKIAYGYRNGRPYIKTIYLLDGD